MAKSALCAFKAIEVYSLDEVGEDAGRGNCAGK